MQTNPTHPIQRGVDREELDRHIAEMYCDVANTGVEITPEQLLKADRLAHDEPVSFRHARIAEAGRVLLPGRRLGARRHPTELQIAKRTACQADLWARCIAGASRRELYLADIGAGLEPQLVQPNPGYRFTSERPQRTSEKCGAHSISPLALNPVRGSRHPSRPDLGDGADVARAASEEG